jgi:energy-coupling factor transporter ATP-binding protein EcfA2
MTISKLQIKGFRGIASGSVSLDKFTVLIGQNNSGKTTIIEALALLLGRDRLVRNLTEHDFFGSCPTAGDRISIIGTIAGFEPNDPERHPEWFRAGRGVPKWQDAATGKLKALPDDGDEQLACQIAFMAWFDEETLEVETVRYFYDDAAQIDPFDENASVTPVPMALIKELGFFLVPANRTWDRMMSFGSELFRRVVGYVGGKPAEAVLEERDRLRSPKQRLEEDDKLKELVGKVNADIAALFGQTPKLKLRLTSTDSEGVLDAVVPHYADQENGIALPSRRHGNGLISLQTLILLMRFGSLRVANNENFLMAIEEPELHVPPPQQRKLMHLMQSLASQAIVTSHSPAVAAVAAPHQVTLVSNAAGQLRAKALLDKPLDVSATNVERGLFSSDRDVTVFAIMHPRVLVPEGKLDARWFRLLARLADLAGSEAAQSDGAFTHEIGVVPTKDAKVVETFKLLRAVHPSVVCLVDGDDAGDGYVTALSALDEPPAAIIQWPNGWEMENVIAWMVEADPTILSDEQLVEAGVPPTVADFLEKLVEKKTDEVMHGLLADAMLNSAACVTRVRHVLRVVAGVCAGRADAENVATCKDMENSTTKVWTLRDAVPGI